MPPKKTKETKEKSVKKKEKKKDKDASPTESYLINKSRYNVMSEIATDESCIGKTVAKEFARNWGYGKVSSYTSSPPRWEIKYQVRETEIVTSSEEVAELLRNGVDLAKEEEKGETFACHLCGFCFSSGLGYKYHINHLPCEKRYQKTERAEMEDEDTLLKKSPHRAPRSQSSSQSSAPSSNRGKRLTKSTTLPHIEESCYNLYNTPQDDPVPTTIIANMKKKASGSKLTLFPNWVHPSDELVDDDSSLVLSFDSWTKSNNQSIDNNQNPIEFCMKEENDDCKSWESLPQYTTRKLDSTTSSGLSSLDAVLNCGMSVSSIDIQRCLDGFYVAIGGYYSNLANQGTPPTMGVPTPGPNLIQLWFISGKETSRPELKYCIGHEGGSVLMLQWAPLGVTGAGSSSSPPTSQRMGVLAVVSSDGGLRIYAPPIDLPKHGVKPQASSSAQETITPLVYCLPPLSCNMPSHNTCFTCLKWRPVIWMASKNTETETDTETSSNSSSCHVMEKYVNCLAVGVSDGSVWIFNLTPTPPPPLSHLSSATSTRLPGCLIPTNRFLALDSVVSCPSLSAVTGISWHPLAAIKLSTAIATVENKPPLKTQATSGMFVCVDLSGTTHAFDLSRNHEINLGISTNQPIHWGRSIEWYNQTKIMYGGWPSSIQYITMGDPGPSRALICSKYGLENVTKFQVLCLPHIGEVCLFTASDGTCSLFSLHAAHHLFIQRAKSRAKKNFDETFKKAVVLHTQNRKAPVNGIVQADTTEGDAMTDVDGAESSSSSNRNTLPHSKGYHGTTDASGGDATSMKSNVSISSGIKWRCFATDDSFDFAPDSSPLTTVTCCMAPKDEQFSSTTRESASGKLKKLDKNLKRKQLESKKEEKKVQPVAKKCRPLKKHISSESDSSEEDDDEEEEEDDDEKEDKECRYHGLVMIGSSCGMVRCQILNDSLFKQLSL